MKKKYYLKMNLTPPTSDQTIANDGFLDSTRKTFTVHISRVKPLLYKEVHNIPYDHLMFEQL